MDPKKNEFESLNIEDEMSDYIDNGGNEDDQEYQEMQKRLQDAKEEEEIEGRYLNLRNERISDQKAINRYNQIHHNEIVAQRKEMERNRQKNANNLVAADKLKKSGSSLSERAASALASQKTSNRVAKGSTKLPLKARIAAKAANKVLNKKNKSKELNPNAKPKAAAKAVDSVSKIKKLVKVIKTLLPLIKALLIIGAVVAACGFVFVMGAVIYQAVDELLTAEGYYYGTGSDAGGTAYYLIEEMDDAAEYYYNEDGSSKSYEDIITSLEDDYSCSQVTLWNGIEDDVTDEFKGKNGSCKFLRFIKTKTDGTNADRGLIISTIHYGYNSASIYNNYRLESGLEEVYYPIDNYSRLKQMLTDDNNFLNKAKIEQLINYSISNKKDYYYTWIIENTYDNYGNVIKKTGKCEKRESEKSYNLEKWKIFMRFGKEVADKYDELSQSMNAYEFTSSECNGSISNDELLHRVRQSASNGIRAELDENSVNEAKNNVKQISESVYQIFSQKASDEKADRDIFKSYNGIEFDYRNGFIYQNFPSYKTAMEDNRISVNYDEVKTPKEIERLIEFIIIKKSTYNSAINQQDKDLEKNTSGYSSSGVVLGKYCGDYLTSSLDQIKVRLVDCYGNYMSTVDFKDYIIGVTNGEVGNGKDDYVLSQMIAAISYSLNRRGNYKKGNLITMKSGTCDQVYCSPLRGCNSIKTPVGSCSICASFYIGGSRGLYPKIYSRLEALYEKASDFLLISNDKVHNAHYVSTIQNEWSRKAKLGMNFSQILLETYGSEGASLVRCSDQTTAVENKTTNVSINSKKGNKATSEYPEVAADRGKFYGFSYKSDEDGIHFNVNPEWINENLTTIKPNCSDAKFASMSFVVHKNAIDNYDKAFNGICKLITKGAKISNGDTCKYSIDDLLNGQTYLPSKSTSGTIPLRSYGLAQVWNYSKKIVVNGVTYMPYNTRDLAEYQEFVNALGGNEEDCRNINYILWLKAYKNAGFNWGGNFGRNGNSGIYNGKIFELQYE